MRRARGCIATAHGVLTIICAALEMAAAFVITGLLREVARKGDVALSETAAWMLDHPLAIAAAALPAMLVGLLAIARPQRNPVLFIALEGLLLAVPFLLILAMFLMVIGPLYQFEPI